MWAHVAPKSHRSSLHGCGCGRGGCSSGRGRAAPRRRRAPEHASLGHTPGAATLGTGALPLSMTPGMATLGAGALSLGVTLGRVALLVADKALGHGRRCWGRGHRRHDCRHGCRTRHVVGYRSRTGHCCELMQPRRSSPPRLHPTPPELAQPWQSLPLHLHPTPPSPPPSSLPRSQLRRA
jgi:hypothetical protein